LKITFHYKEQLDPEGILQFGLVAEDVAKVNPDLVVYDDDGKPYTVRYEAVNAMLLNEFLKEHRKVQAQEHKVQQLEKTRATARRSGAAEGVAGDRSQAPVGPRRAGSPVAKDERARGTCPSCTACGGERLIRRSARTGFCTFQIFHDSETRCETGKHVFPRRVTVRTCNFAQMVFIPRPAASFLNVAPLVPGFASLDAKPRSPGETRRFGKDEGGREKDEIASGFSFSVLISSLILPPSS
jgi:hypothetical protein